MGKPMINPKHKGRLHRALGIPEGQPIPMAEKEKAAHSKDPALAAEGRFAVAAAGFRHPGGKRRKKRSGAQKVRDYLNSPTF